MTQAQLIQKIKETQLFASAGACQGVSEHAVAGESEFENSSENGFENAWEFKETQLSYIFLTKEKAYKIKKSLDIGALGLSALESRRRFCEQEIALNSGDSPALCLGLCIIYQHPDGTPTFENTGTPVEYAVAMNRFAEDMVFLRMLERNALEEKHLRQLLDTVAKNHQTATKSPESGLYDQICTDCQADLEALRQASAGLDPQLSAHLDPHLIEKLHALFEEALQTHKSLIERRAKTHVKLFHRDLSLEGICWHEGEAAFFDGMPVHKEPQKADTMADLATLMVDLFYLDHQQLVFFALNRYLKKTDDFDGLPLLRLYSALQALQRCVSHCLTAPELKHQQAQQREMEKAKLYGELALVFLQGPKCQRLVVFGGFSGAGKTTLARPTAQRIGAVHIRADAVRKHLLGVPVSQPAPPEAYQASHQAATYDSLLTRADKVLKAGLSVVLDGIYGAENDRDDVGVFAAAHNLPYTAFWCVVPTAVAHQRMAERLARMGKADQEVGENHEKNMFTDAGRITWHRLDTVNGKDYVKERVFDLLKLSSPHSN